MYAQKARIHAESRTFSPPLNFSLNFCVSLLKQSFLPNHYTGLTHIQIFLFRAHKRRRAPTGVHHTGCWALRSAALGAAFIGMAHDKILQVAALGIHTHSGRKFIKVHQRVLKHIPAESNSWGRLHWIDFSARAAELWTGEEERRGEISNLPQMEPLCPVTYERSAGS